MSDYTKTPADIIERMERLRIKPNGRPQAAEIMRQRQIANVISASKLPKRFASNDNLDLGGHWGEYNQALASAQGHNGFLITITGVRGCGKTQLAAEAIKRNAANLKQSLYITATEFFMAIKATYRKDSQATERDVIERHRKPSLLVIDEASKRGETDWENNLFFELLNKRYGDMTDTILIANLSVSDFIASIGPSLASRLNETGGIKDCSNWRSFRG